MCHAVSLKSHRRHRWVWVLDGVLSPIILSSCHPRRPWARALGSRISRSQPVLPKHKNSINTYVEKCRWSHTHSLLSPRWVNTSSSCWRQTRTPPSRTPALLGLGWIPLDLGAFNLGLIAPVTALTLGYRSAWSPGTALSHLGSASIVAQGLYSDIGLKT